MAPYTRSMHRLSQIRNWSQLEKGILDLILQKLPYLDCFNFGKICTWWRSVFLYRRRHSHPPPCILLRSNQGRSTLHRGIFNGGQFLRLFSPQPELRRSQLIVGSCFGWLVIACIFTSDIYLLNPASNERTPLPSLASFVVRHIDMSSSPGNGHCVLVARIVYRQTPVHCLAWCSPSDEKWTIVTSSLLQQSLASVFHNGKLHVLQNNGDLVVYPNNLQQNIAIQVSIYNFRSINHMEFKRLVRSDGELFLVVGQSFCSKLQVFINREEQGCSSWVRMDSLGDRVLMIGIHGAESLWIKDLMGSTYDPNSIYYTYSTGFNQYLHKYSMTDQETENIPVAEPIQEWVLTPEW